MWIEYAKGRKSSTFLEAVANSRDASNKSVSELRRDVSVDDEVRVARLRVPAAIVVQERHFGREDVRRSERSSAERETLFEVGRREARHEVRADRVHRVAPEHKLSADAGAEHFRLALRLQEQLQVERADRGVAREPLVVRVLELEERVPCVVHGRRDRREVVLVEVVPCAVLGRMWNQELPKANKNFVFQTLFYWTKHELNKQVMKERRRNERDITIHIDIILMAYHYDIIIIGKRAKISYV